ncbi:dihydrofolate reductase family protein [uncultured Chitinophaga sp.]|uniref:dihydrofolate reductase family protein n=1 Tax=uncultured Chitinophaga sp. TaxID=339340 RepID=UPI0025E47FE3|nr:dihydrofolate reductase family protein [uncultured Chitinophaga sp.]
MGKINLTWQASLDGVVTDLEKWMNMPDEIVADSLAYYDGLDAIIIGGNTYAGLAEYWQHAETSSPSELERRFAKKINDMKKYVISSEPKELVWRNSEQILFEDEHALRSKMEQLKRQFPNDISVESGLGSWQKFITQNQYDRIHICVHPVIAGSGKKVFEGVMPETLEVISTKEYPNGVISTWYEKK